MPPSVPEPGEIELINALYAGPLITAALAAHDVPRIPAGGARQRRGLALLATFPREGQRTVTIGA